MSAIPAFLRDGDRDSRAPRDAPIPDRRLALPRPANPPSLEPSPTGGSFDPAALPMPTLSRRRVVTAAGILLAGWLAITFARQVGEASAATGRAEQLRAGNAALRDEIARLEADLMRVQDRAYILQQGRRVGLGSRGEVAFALGADAPSLPPDAPGSAATRLGARTDDQTPLEGWLTVLFGPD
jgi:hypothetical protein